MRRLIVALAALSISSAANAAAPANKWHAHGRDIFRNVIEIPSVTDRPEEVKKMVGYLKGKFEAGEIGDVVVKDHDGTQSMIIRWKAAGKPKAKPILLLGHMDVVEARSADWPRDPFVLTEADGNFYGRGTIDMKNGIAAIANALIWLKAEGFKPRRDIIVLFTGDEETNGNGALRASTEWRSEVEAEYALNADAGGGAFREDGTLIGYAIQTSEKMYQSYYFTARNTGGHSSQPRADNAIYDLAAALKRLETHRFTPMLNDSTRGYYGFRQKQEPGALGDAMRRWLANPEDGAAADIVEADPNEIGGTRTRCVATRLEGGHADNALPQMARATVNCRIFPGVDAASVTAELKALAGAGVEVEPFGDAKASPPSPLRADVLGAYTRAIRKRHPGAQVVPDMSAGATDGLFFRATGMPVYGVNGSWVTLPTGGNAHGRDERISVKSFYETLDHWHDMLKELAG